MLNNYITFTSNEKMFLIEQQGHYDLMKFEIKNLNKIYLFVLVLQKNSIIVLINLDLLLKVHQHIFNVLKHIIIMYSYKLCFLFKSNYYFFLFIYIEIFISRKIKYQFTFFGSFIRWKSFILSKTNISCT